MARKRIPSYRLHKPSGLAVVSIAGKDHYLGRHGSEESHRAYDRLIARYLSGDTGPAPHDATLAEVLVRYWRHVEAMNYDYRQYLRAFHTGYTGEARKERMAEQADRNLRAAARIRAWRKRTMCK